MKIVSVREEKIDELYVISLITPTRESYVECREIIDGFDCYVIEKGYAGGRDAKKAILFPSPFNAYSFARYNLKTSYPFKIKKVGKRNMERLNKTGLTPYSMEKYRFGNNYKDYICYLQNKVVIKCDENNK